MFRDPHGRWKSGWNEKGRHGKGVRKCLTWTYHSHHSAVELYMRIEGYLFHVGYVNQWDRAQEDTGLHQTRVDLDIIASLLVTWATTGRQETISDTFVSGGEYHKVSNTLMLSF